MALIRTALMTALAAWSFGCSKDEPLKTDFEDPRPARPPLPESLEATFEVQPSSRIEFSLPARKDEPTGYFSRIEGRIWLDLLDLDDARATLKTDLTSVQMTGSDDPALDAERSRQARYWLGLGGSSSDEPRESARWAEFVLEEVGEVTAEAAHEGKQRKGGSPSSDERAAEGEIRQVRLVARGALTLNSVRVRYVAPLTAAFHYPAPAIAGELPDRLELSSRAPIRLSLEAHDIKPRNADGHVVATDLEKLGKRVGREAKIRVKIEARRQNE